MAFAHTEYERTVIGMDDYIKREALRDALYDADAITMNGVKILNQFPAADVEPVKHGRWVCGDYYDVGDVCSECDWDSQMICPSYRYCPNCGAKMDGECDT